ncbi:hypothetical protein AYI68_g2632 [Smittium mucronatum]|uniref:Uncharacterized protein n=1 Tax=Smittium mucronatum TaxID=133383 RepID=A0A1R0H2A3_9FUNG|nr:hypothetical protein AYI68_g2632 [Smittium mucronatum]
MGLEESLPPDALLTLVQNSLRSFGNSFDAEYLISKAADVAVSLALRLWPNGIWSEFPTWIIHNLNNDILVLRIIQSIGEEILEYQSEPIVSMRKSEFTSGISVAFLPLFIINDLYPEGFKLDSSGAGKRRNNSTKRLELIKPLQGNENGWIEAIFIILNNPEKSNKVREIAINALQSYLNWLPFLAFQKIPQIIISIRSLITNPSCLELKKYSLECLLTITSRNYPVSSEKTYISELLLDEYKIYNELNFLLGFINDQNNDLDPSEIIEFSRMIYKIITNVAENLIFYKKSSSPIPNSIIDIIGFMVSGLTSKYITVSEISACGLLSLNNNKDQIQKLNVTLFGELQPIIIQKMKHVFSIVSSKNKSLDWEDESDGILGGNFESESDYKLFAYGKLYTKLFDILKFIAKLDPLSFSIFVINQVGSLFQNGTNQIEHLETDSERCNLVNTGLALIEVAAKSLEHFNIDIQTIKDGKIDSFKETEVIESSNRIYNILIHYKCDNPEIIRLQLSKIESFSFLIQKKPELILTCLTFLTSFLSKPPSSTKSPTEPWSKVSYKASSVLETLVRSNTNIFWKYYFDFVSLSKQHSVDSNTPSQTKIMLWELLISFFTSDTPLDQSDQIPKPAELNELAINLISPVVTQFEELGKLLESPNKLLGMMGVDVIGFDSNKGSSIDNYLQRIRSSAKFRSDVYHILLTMNAFVKPLTRLFDLNDPINFGNKNLILKNVDETKLTLHIYISIIESIATKVIRISLELTRIIHLVFNHQLLNQVVSKDIPENIIKEHTLESINGWSQFLSMKLNPIPKIQTLPFENSYGESQRFYSSVSNILELANKIVGSLTYCPTVYYEIADFGSFYSSCMFGEANFLPLNVWKSIFINCLRPLIIGNTRPSTMAIPLENGNNNFNNKIKKVPVVKPPTVKQSSAVFSSFLENLNGFLVDKVVKMNLEFSSIHNSEGDMTEYESNYRLFMRSLSSFQSEMIEGLDFGRYIVNLGEFWNSEEMIPIFIKNKFSNSNLVKSGNKVLMGYEEGDMNSNYRSSNMFDMLKTSSDNNFALEVDHNGNMDSSPKPSFLNTNFLSFLVSNQPCTLGILRGISKILDTHDLISTRNLIISIEQIFPITLLYTINYTKYQALFSSTLEKTDSDSSFLEFLSVVKQTPVSKIKKSFSSIQNSPVEMLRFYSLLSEFSTTDLISQLIKMLSDIYYIELKEKIIHIIGTILYASISASSAPSINTQNSNYTGSFDNSLVTYNESNNHYWINAKQSLVNESMSILKERFNYQQTVNSLNTYFKNVLDFDSLSDTETSSYNNESGNNNGIFNEKKKGKFMFTVTKELLDPIINWKDSHDLLASANKNSDRIISAYKKKTSKNTVIIKEDGFGGGISGKNHNSLDVFDSSEFGEKEGFDLSNFIP